MHPFTGPWRIVRSLPGASYELEFATDPKWTEKKHASDLAPFPQELIPFKPVDGPDNRYSQLYKGFGPSPYKEAGIKGFTPAVGQSALPTLWGLGRSSTERRNGVGF